MDYTSAKTMVDGIESDAGVKAAPKKAARSSKPHEVNGKATQPAAKDILDNRHPSGNRTYTEAERVKLMENIAARVNETGCTFKDAIKQSGISEQTYYQWKKLPKYTSGAAISLVEAAPEHIANGSLVNTGAASATTTDEPLNDLGLSFGGDALPDIVQLRQENLRLRKVLADKLRAANEELRKMIDSI